VKKCIAAAVNEVDPLRLSDYNEISLSRRTITRRIEDIGDNLQQQLEQKVQNFNFFAIALDESTDVVDTAQLLIFVRGIDSEFNIMEELAALQSMKSRTMGEDIYKEVLACVQKLKLEWKYLCGVTTDGAPSMIGSDVGAVARIKNLLKSKNIADPLAVHCIIHVEVLCSKTFEMPHVMDVVVKVVNFIRSRGLNHRQFKAFLEEIECPYDVIYHNSVR